MFYCDPRGAPHPFRKDDRAFQNTGRVSVKMLRKYVAMTLFHWHVSFWTRKICSRVRPPRMT